MEKKKSVPVAFKRHSFAYNIRNKHPNALLENFPDEGKFGSVIIESHIRPVNSSHNRQSRLDKDPSPEGTSQDPGFVNRAIKDPASLYVSDGRYDDWSLSDSDWEKIDSYWNKAKKKLCK